VAPESFFQVKTFDNPRRWAGISATAWGSLSDVAGASLSKLLDVYLCVESLMQSPLTSDRARETFTRLLIVLDEEITAMVQANSTDSASGPNSGDDCAA
jgi:hypothetical protein